MPRRLKAITCAVFAREAYACAADSPCQVDIDLFPKGLHDQPDIMRATLQAQIDAVPADRYEAILLVYGLCGRGTHGLAARDLPLVMTRAHDCITLFLGSRDRYSALHAESPGTYYLTTGWIERAQGEDSFESSFAKVVGLGGRYEDYVEKYGEENARYLMEVEAGWQQNYERYVYIDMGIAPPEPYLEWTRRRAAERGLADERLAGDLSLLRDLFHGHWDDERFLVVPPGETLVQAAGDPRVIASRAGGEQ